jgi:ribosome-associated protein YbcJ (S4-like RNA binding protein)
MRFYLQRETDFIYLDQLLKATAVLEDYLEIRIVIDQGRVSVNGDVTKHRRKMLKAGDVVRYREHHIMVLSNKARPKKQDALPEKEIHIRHGKGPQKWHEKALKPKKGS